MLFFMYLFVVQKQCLLLAAFNRGETGEYSGNIYNNRNEKTAELMTEVLANKETPLVMIGVDSKNQELGKIEIGTNKIRLQ